MMENNILFWTGLTGILWFANAVIGLFRGRIWVGSLGLKPFRPSRQEKPVTYWIFTLFFTFTGGMLLLFSILGYLGFIYPEIVLRRFL
jgi:hypothetical protein